MCLGPAEFAPRARLQSLDFWIFGISKLWIWGFYVLGFVNCILSKSVQFSKIQNNKVPKIPKTKLWTLQQKQKNKLWNLPKNKNPNFGGCAISVLSRGRGEGGWDWRLDGN